MMSMNYQNMCVIYTALHKASQGQYIKKKGDILLCSCPCKDNVAVASVESEEISQKVTFAFHFIREK